MADAHETLGQYVLEESPQELGRRDSHLLLLASMRIILPQKGHLTIRNGDDAVIGDGHTVGVAGQVAEDTAPGRRTAVLYRPPTRSRKPS